MRLENLIKIKNLIGIEISDSLKEIGTKNMKILCDANDYIRALIERLENPDKANKFDKLEQSKIWKG